MSYYVDVILPLNIKNLLTYALDENLYAQCQLGSRVAVPLGENKLHTAIVVNIHKNKPLHYDAKPVNDILDAFPIINIFQLKLFKWVKNYYLCEYGEILRACLPNALLIQSETLVQLTENYQETAHELSDEEYLVVEAIERQTQIKFSDVQKILDKINVLKIINGLIEKNIVFTDKQVKHKYSPKLESYVRIADKFREAENFNKLIESLDRAHKQKELVFNYFKLIGQSQKPLTKKILLKQTSTGHGVFNALVEKQVFEEYYVKQDRIKTESRDKNSDFRLSDAQAEALKEIRQHFDANETVLLKGVT